MHTVKCRRERVNISRRLRLTRACGSALTAVISISIAVSHSDDVYSTALNSQFADFAHRN